MGMEFGVTVSKGYLLTVIACKCELLRTAVELKRESNRYMEKTA
jgi:hypothetical protein